ncbi:MAG: 3-hydroxyacyl-CoA dehydrogenase NAD-binding domain-containing protein [Pseudomonadota bacterium]|nr:3-hydroxyacyl-CoA dehydrogenase NAD-binding domain-containing protein [Pseudomonadota bacterium]
MYKDPHDVKKIASLGGGPIGAGWAAYFLSRGYIVKSYIHSKQEESSYRVIIDTAWESLKDLGLSKDATLENLLISNKLDEVLKEVDFVQESISEILDIKREFYRTLGDLVPKNVVIASSTSGLTMTQIQKFCSTPERTVIGHPFNPPYILPLVEIVGGKNTEPPAIQWASNFYEISGKKPLIMKKEIPGFVATRLQEALWREALHMVNAGEASPEQIDMALIHGPAPRMAVQGQCMAFHVACGEGGMSTNLDQFGPLLGLPWTRLRAPKLTKKLRNQMVDGCNKMAKGKHFSDMARQRDRSLVAVLNALKNS